MYGRTRRNHAVSKSVCISQSVVHNVTEGTYKTNGKTKQRDRKYYIPIKITGNLTQILHLKEFLQRYLWIQGICEGLLTLPQIFC